MINKNLPLESWEGGQPKIDTSDIFFCSQFSLGKLVMTLVVLEGFTAKWPTKLDREVICVLNQK